jgi:multidrug efflux pump subunit AcrA (membrane-fusion protein)
LEKEEQELDTARYKLISESKVELELARMKAETIERDYKATKQVLDATQSVSEEELWSKELEYKQAVAEYNQWKVAEEREAVEYKIADAKLRERLIVAPFDGVIAKINLHTAESCNPQQPLVRIADVRKCRFITYAEAKSIPGLASGMKETLRLDGARSTVSRPGVVEFISPVIDPSSGLREVKVVFDNSDGAIQPGVGGTMIP